MPHRAIADVPTPVVSMPVLAEELGVQGLLIKRDDQSGRLYGGNKTRKLEFLLGDAMDKGHDEVWTVGAIGSNHVLATSIWARELGLKPGALHYPQQMTDHVRHNLLALSTTAPNLTLTSSVSALPFHLFKTKLKEWLSTNPEVYYISGGGSSGVGVVGYVDAALELAEQIEAGECERPDRIYVAAGTCGTLAGLLLGFAYANLPVRVIGVRVVDKVITNAPNVARLYHEGARYLSQFGVPMPESLSYRDVELRDDYFGDGYGQPTDVGLDAIRLLEEHGGPHLEPTYTAKTFSAVVAEADDASDETVMYWHTLSGADLSERLADGSIDKLPAEYAAFF
jgi:D-cysteine desulfhydrase